MLTKENWGNAVWYLFHTLAFKLKKEHENLIPSLINFIKNTCNELPCPDCKVHALKYIKHYNMDKIKTKEELVIYLTTFHNVVNRILNKPRLSYEQSNELYNRANTDNIIRNYINVMSKSTGNMKLMMNTFARRTTVESFKKFIMLHRKGFN